nr:hypothetical protein [uncultured Flavobacterium sp.]
MASTSETGHTKNVANFETLISFCTGYGATYNPSNTSIALAALNTMKTSAKATIQTVKTTKVPADNAEGVRMLAFKPLKPLATKVLGALKAVNAPVTLLKDAETINKKIQGKSAATGTTTAEGEAAAKTISTSQQSYDMRIDHFKNLVELVKTEPKYIPNETPIKVVTLTTYITQLETANAAVTATYTPYSNAMIARNKSLYTPITGLVDTAKDVKNYIKSLYGSTSPEYKQISSIKFTIPRNS